MDAERFDAISTALGDGLSRGYVIALLLGGLGGVVSRRGPGPVAAGERKPVGANCHRHSQCASGLCEVTSGACVAQRATLDESCGVGGICQPIGPGGLGNACVLVPADLNCAGYTPYTWNDRAKDPADQLSCPHQTGYVCLLTGLCNGPEEVCVPLSPPA